MWLATAPIALVKDKFYTVEPDVLKVRANFVVSADGGATWSQGALPNTTTYAGGTMSDLTDPVVAYDVRHATWMLSYIGDAPSVNGVYVSLSADGLNWGSPVRVAQGPAPESWMPRVAVASPAWRLSTGPATDAASRSVRVRTSMPTHR